MKKDELKSYTGKEGEKAYIEYKGRVYDVTDSKLWANGVHMARHKAGEDLTDFMSMSPHGEEALDKVKEVDRIEEDIVEKSAEWKQKLRDLYRKFHPHPIMIHFPMGLFIFGTIMQIIFLFSGNNSFEKSAYYSISFATLSVFPAVLSGFFSWWINYDMTMTSIFRNKIIFSIFLLIFGLAEVIMRSLYPGISTGSDARFFLYNILLIINTPVTLIIGYYGGKITWPS